MDETLSQQSWRMAKGFLIATAPWLTMFGFEMIFHHPDDVGILWSPFLRALGVPMAIGGFVLDCLKAPFTLAGAVAMAILSCIQR